MMVMGCIGGTVNLMYAMGSAYMKLSSNQKNRQLQQLQQQQVGAQPAVPMPEQQQ